MIADPVHHVWEGGLGWVHSSVLHDRIETPFFLPPIFMFVCEDRLHWY